MNVCEETFRIYHVCISQKVKRVMMWNLRHITFMWRRRYRQIFKSALTCCCSETFRRIHIKALVIELVFQQSYKLWPAYLPKRALLKQFLLKYARFFRMTILLNTYERLLLVSLENWKTKVHKCSNETNFTTQKFLYSDIISHCSDIRLYITILEILFRSWSVSRCTNHKKFPWCFDTSKFCWFLFGSSIERSYVNVTSK